MYTTKCFIRKSNKDISDKVYKLGYRNGTGLTLFDKPNFYSCAMIVACGDYYCSVDNENDNDKKLIEQGFIDCGNNEDLFLAIAALSDNTDKNQYFFCDIDDGDNAADDIVFKCSCDNVSEHVETLKRYYDEVYNIRKMTVKELIKYFSE